MHIFTICTRSYLAHCSVLAESLAHHNDGLKLSVVLVDGESKSEFDLAEVVLPQELPFDSDEEFRRMATIYDVVELSTAIKPWALRYFLDRGHEAVVYLDPDIQVFESLAPLEAMCREHGIVLNPHTTRPLPRDERLPAERDLLLAGSYNLGFIGVGKAAVPMLDWWSERLRRDCVNNVQEGLFVDQRWIDLVPSYFDHILLKDPGYNVAYWNLPGRTVEENGDGSYLVDGKYPLRFFHFSGFSPNAPHLLTKHQGPEPRILLSDRPAVAKLCRDYARGLRRHGYARWSRTPYRYDRTGHGMQIDRRARRAYRAALIEAERNQRELPVPTPFTPEGGEALMQWLREPSGAGGGSVSRYLREVHQERADLRTAFPNIEGADAERFLNWIRQGGIVDPPVPEQLFPEGEGVEPALPARAEAPRAESPQPHGLKRGVNLYGYVFAESGTGQIGRSLVATLRDAGIPYAVIPFTETINRQEHRFADRGDSEAVYDTNLICVNADQVPVFLHKMGSHILKDRYNIGVWAWEVDDMPESMARSEQFLDEVWGISAYTAAGLRNRLSIPVRAFPLPVVPNAPATRSRAELGLPEGFLYLFCFDFESVFDRKNPLGVIEAYRRAFPERGETRLCIKSVNGQRHVAELERLRSAAADRPDIVIIDGYRGAEEHAALMNACDVYVSLHRAEGFGFTVAEAMILAKPVICSAYSSTMEFTTDDNSYLVPAKVVNVPEGTPAYPPTARWGNPDVDAAASMMRHVFENQDEAKAVGERGRRDMVTLHGSKARAPYLRELLDEARRAKREGAVQQKRVLSGPIVVPGLGSSPAEELASALMLRPNPDLPSRISWLARPMRKLMLRLIRNYWVHQREVDRAILDAVRSAREGGRQEVRVLGDAVSHRLQQLDRAITESNRSLRAELQALEARVAKLAEHRDEAKEITPLPVTRANEPGFGRGDIVRAREVVETATSVARDPGRRSRR